MLNNESLAMLEFSDLNEGFSVSFVVQIAMLRILSLPELLNMWYYHTNTEILNMQHSFYDSP